MKQQKTNPTNRKQKAFYYYSLGLNSKEIAKLLDISHRTIQGYMQREQWKKKLNPTPIKQRAYKLHKAGYTYKELAQLFNKSIVTIYLWIKQAKAGTTGTPEQ